MHVKLQDKYIPNLPSHPPLFFLFNLLFSEGLKTIEKLTNPRANDAKVKKKKLGKGKQLLIIILNHNMDNKKTIRTLERI